MSSMEACLEKHKTVWQSVARYSVVRNDRQQDGPAAGINTIVQGNMLYADATELANAKAAPYLGKSSWTKPMFTLKIENPDEALAAVRAADIWSGLTQ